MADIYHGKGLCGNFDIVWTISFEMFSQLYIIVPRSPYNYYFNYFFAIGLVLAIHCL